jgi:hypothetical protein
MPRGGHGGLRALSDHRLALLHRLDSRARLWRRSAGHVRRPHSDKGRASTFWRVARRPHGVAGTSSHVRCSHAQVSLQGPPGRPGGPLEPSPPHSRLHVVIRDLRLLGTLESRDAILGLIIHISQARAPPSRWVDAAAGRVLKPHHPVCGSRTRVGHAASIPRGRHGDAAGATRARYAHMATHFSGCACLAARYRGEPLPAPCDRQAFAPRSSEQRLRRQPAVEASSPRSGIDGAVERPEGMHVAESLDTEALARGVADAGAGGPQPAPGALVEPELDGAAWAAEQALVALLRQQNAERRWAAPASRGLPASRCLP